MLRGERAQSRADRCDLGEQRIPRRPQHACVGEVIDVLGRTPEVNELECSRGRAGSGKLVSNVVLDGFHVMIRSLLDLFDFERRIHRRVEGETASNGKHAFRKLGHSRETYRFFAVKREPPFGFDADALSDQGGLGEVGSKRLGAAEVAAVDRGEGIERVESHAELGTLKMLGCESYPMPDTAPVLTPLTDLKSTLRSRLLSSPCHAPANDWRLGKVSEARKRRLRKFFPEHPTPAAVLVPLVDRGDDLGILLTVRSSALKHHAGQISFPGGRIESIDTDPLCAALRETEEEIGLGRDRIEVAGYLPDHLVITGYRVTPVVGFVAPGFTVAPDPTEVVEVFEMPLSVVLDERNHVPTVRHFEGEAVHFIDFPYGPHTIWGATAGMLMTLYRTLRGEPG